MTVIADCRIPATSTFCPTILFHVDALLFPLLLPLLDCGEECFHYLPRLGCQSSCPWPKFRNALGFIGGMITELSRYLTLGPLYLHPSYTFRQGLDVIPRTVPWDLLAVYSLSLSIVPPPHFLNVSVCVADSDIFYIFFYSNSISPYLSGQPSLCRGQMWEG